MKTKLILLLILCLLLSACGSNINRGRDGSPSPPVSPGGSQTDTTGTPSATPDPTPVPQSIVDSAGMTIDTRYNPPAGFTRVEVEEGSFAAWLRGHALREANTVVYSYNEGNASIRGGLNFDAVLELDVGTRNLPIGTDLLIRVRADYLYENERYGDMLFHFMSGDEFSFRRYSEGNRITVDGSKVTWAKTAEAGAGSDVYKSYLTQIYSYSNKTAILQDLVEMASVAIGNVFIDNGGAMIVDMARDETTGQLAVIVLQSGDTTQDLYIVKNIYNAAVSPWVIVSEEGSISTGAGDYLLSAMYKFS